jgi:hypothetical protein
VAKVAHDDDDDDDDDDVNYDGEDAKEGENDFDSDADENKRGAKLITRYKSGRELYEGAPEGVVSRLARRRRRQCDADAGWRDRASTW